MQRMAATHEHQARTQAMDTQRMATMDNDEIEDEFWSVHRGYDVVFRNGDWYYEDGVRVDDDPDRPCARCGEAALAGGEDYCLGHLPGVANACCGHGAGESYIQFTNGVIIRFNLISVSHDEEVKNG